MAFESIISGELARQAQGSRDIQNIFAQFGAGIEQGRQQRAQQEAGMQIAEQEIAAMSKIDPSIAEQFMSVAETGKPQDIINFANAAKAGLALTQQQEQADLRNQLLTGQIAQTGAQTGLTGAQTGLTEAKTAAQIEDTKTLPARRETEQQIKQTQLQVQLSNLDLAKQKLAQATSPEAQKLAQTELQMAEAKLAGQLEKNKKAQNEFIQNQSKSIKSAIQQAQKTKNTEDLIQKITDLVNSSGRIGATGLIGQIMRKTGITSSDAGRVGALVKTLQADAAFSELKDLKAAGGTLGQVSNQELALLENAVASLNPDLPKEEFLAQLEKFKQIRKQSMANVAEALRQEGKEVPQSVLDIIGVTDGNTTAVATETVEFTPGSQHTRTLPDGSSVQGTVSQDGAFLIVPGGRFPIKR